MSLQGPFQISAPIVDELVESGVPGVYVVRRIEDTGAYAFWTGRLGRADTDLRAELKQWVDSPYRLFLFEHTTNAEAAVERERELWQELGGAEGKLDNETAPESVNQDSDGCERNDGHVADVSSVDVKPSWVASESPASAKERYAQMLRDEAMSKRSAEHSPGDDR